MPYGQLSFRPGTRRLLCCVFKLKCNCCRRPPPTRDRPPSQWRDVEKQLSALNAAKDAPADLAFWQFRFALQRRQFDQAQTLLTRLRETSFSPIGIAMAEAELLAAQEKMDEAVAKLNEATEKFPQSAELVRHLAILLDRQGDRDKCEQVLKQALARIEDPLAQRETALLLAQLYSRWDAPTAS